MGTRPMQSCFTFSISPVIRHSPGTSRAIRWCPAWLILDVVRRAAEPSFGPGLRITRVPQAKFVRPLLPGQEAAVDLELRETLLQFVVSRGDQVDCPGRFRNRRGAGVVTRQWLERPEGGTSWALRLFCAVALGLGRTVSRVILLPVTLTSWCGAGQSAGPPVTTWRVRWAGRRAGSRWRVISTPSPA